MKIIVVEGEVDVSLNERRNQFRTLTAGDMWISRTNDKTGLPMPVQVDLERLKKTSKLLSDKEFPPLGNQKQMKGALEDQAQKKEDGELIDTAFVIEGRGRNVTFFDADREHIPFGNSPPSTQIVGATPVKEKGQPTPPADSVAPPRAIKPAKIAGTTVFDNQSSIDSSNAFNSTTGGFTSLPGTIYIPGADGSLGEYMYDLWTLDANLTNLVFTSLSGSINFESFNLTGTGQNVVFAADGPDSDVNIVGLPAASIFLPTGNLENFAGRDVKVSEASIESRVFDSGRPTIFTDSHKYNNGVNGNFTGLDNSHPAHVNQQSFGSRPAY